MKEERKYVSYDTRFLSTGLDVLNMILLTEIENLSKLEKGCFATDKQLGELILIGEKNTGERIKYIEKLGYIKCQTKFIDGKRQRTILFKFDEVKPPQGGFSEEVKPPQGGLTKRMRKVKVKPPQGGFSEEVKPPQGGYNKLLLEPDTRKEITAEKIGPEKLAGPLEDQIKEKEINKEKEKTSTAAGPLEDQKLGPVGDFSNFKVKDVFDDIEDIDKTNEKEIPTSSNKTYIPNEEHNDYIIHYKTILFNNSNDFIKKGNDKIKFQECLNNNQFDDLIQYVDKTYQSIFTLNINNLKKYHQPAELTTGM